MKIKEMKASQSCEESLHKHRGRTHYTTEGMQLLQPSLLQGRPCIDLQRALLIRDDRQQTQFIVSRCWEDFQLLSCL